MWHDLILNGARALGRERATLPPIHLNRIFPPHRRHCDDMRRKCTKEKKSRAWHAFAHSHFHSIIIVVLLLGENSFSLKIASVFQLLKNHNKKKSFENPLCIHMHDYFNTTKKINIKVKNPPLNHISSLSIIKGVSHYYLGSSSIMYHVSKDRATHTGVYLMEIFLHLTIKCNMMIAQILIMKMDGKLQCAPSTCFSHKFMSDICAQLEVFKYLWIFMVSHACIYVDNFLIFSQTYHLFLQRRNLTPDWNYTGKWFYSLFS